MNDDVFEAPGWFLASPVLRRIVRALWLQLPHLVFIRCTKSRSTLTPAAVAKRASSGGTASLSCPRYHAGALHGRPPRAVPPPACAGEDRVARHFQKSSEDSVKQATGGYIVTRSRS